MRKIAEIRKDLKAQVEAVRAMDATADKAAYDAAVQKAVDLTEELDSANKIEEAEQRLADKQLSDLEKDAKRSFSIVKFVREASEGRLSGLEAEVAEMGAKEYERLGLSKKGFVLPSVAIRASAGQNYTTNADGGYAKVTMYPRYLDGLKDRLAVAKLGATVLGDLVGTLPLVGVGAVTSAWLAEGATATVSKAAFSQAVLTPHRNATFAAFSWTSRPSCGTASWIPTRPSSRLPASPAPVPATSPPVSSTPPTSAPCLSAPTAAPSPGPRSWSSKPS